MVSGVQAQPRAMLARSGASFRQARMTHGPSPVRASPQCGQRPTRCGSAVQATSTRSRSARGAGAARPIAPARRACSAPVRRPAIACARQHDGAVLCRPCEFADDGTCDVPKYCTKGDYIDCATAGNPVINGINGSLPREIGMLSCRSKITDVYAAVPPAARRLPPSAAPAARGPLPL